MFLLDVREPSEHKINVISGSTLIPLGLLHDNFADLPKDRKIVVYCRSGARSASAVAFLQREGFVDCVNLIGGMIAWSDIIKAN